VAAREDEAVTVEPLRVLRVVLHEVTVEHGTDLRRRVSELNEWSAGNWAAQHGSRGVEAVQASLLLAGVVRTSAQPSGRPR